MTEVYLSKSLPLVEPPCLIIDTSHSHAYAGVAQDGAFLTLLKAEAPVLEALPGLLQTLFQNHPLSSLSQVIYCSGPGSTLGLRITLTFLNTWQTLPSLSHLRFFAYQSVRIAAATVEFSSPLDSFAVISPSRLGYFHSLIKKPGSSPYHYTPIEEVPASIISTLPTPLYFLPQAKTWQQHTLPENTTSIAYDITAVPAILSKASFLLEETPTPRLFQYKDASTAFVKWNPERHR